MPRHVFYDKIVPKIETLVRRIAPHRPEQPPPGLLVALSGGPDSVALLLAAQEWATSQQAHLLAAHLNHQLRGVDADTDETFCRNLCQSLQIPLRVRREDPRQLARQRGMGVEEAGRVLRYRFLKRLLVENEELDCMATGHHRDDQTETIVMRLFRGTGLDGLRGIEPVSGLMIRPLLEVTRQEIVAFLEAVRQPYRVDATNLAGELTRSRIRRELLPLARDIFGPGTDKAPARLADLVSADLTLLDQLTRQTLEKLIAPTKDGSSAETADPGELRLLVTPLLNLDRALARRVIRLAFLQQRGSNLDLGRDHVDEMLHWLSHSQSGASVDLPGSWRAVREFDTLRFLPQISGELPLSTRRSYRMLIMSAPEGEIQGTGLLAERRSESVTTPDAACPSGRGWSLECPADALRG